ncbi:MAG TPA: hypothetical protein V6C85_35220 [Allocoleopsis sp.]
MNKAQFHDELTLSETTVKLGRKAMDLGVIHSFVVRYFSDSQQFYIPNEIEAEPLTPEQAYLRLKKMLEEQ